jgi:hypothetical protein
MYNPERYTYNATVYITIILKKDKLETTVSTFVLLTVGGI